MGKFQDAITIIKQLLKDSLNDQNLDLITKLDKEIDNLSQTHEETEKELSSVKDKLIDVVKNTSFKDETGPKLPQDNTEQVMSVDEALEASLKEIEPNRK